MHSIVKLIVIPCLLTFVTCAAQAQPELVCKPADIQGRIVDQNGSPIAGAKVLVQNAPYTQNIYWFATQPEEDLLLGDATSDEDGRYRIKWRSEAISAMNNATAGADILVMKPGYAIAFRQSTLWFDKYLQFELAPDVEHVGKVLDDQGLPLADAEVRIDVIYGDVEWVDRGAVFSMDDDVCSMMISSLRPRAKTDKDGNYRLRGLASGQIVLLQVTHPKFPAIRRMQPADERSPKSIKERLNEDDEFGPWYNSYSKPLQMLSGKLGKIVAIEDVTGKPLANLEVCRGFSGESTKCDQNGNVEYWLPDKESATRGGGNAQYYARRVGDRFWSPAFLTVAEGEAPAKLTVPLQRFISGYVRDQETHEGIEGVGLYFANPDEKSWIFTDQSGRYSLPVHGQLSTITLRGPKMSYDLPVDRWSNQPLESKRAIDAELHQRTVRFDRHQLNAKADFLIPKYPKLVVQVIDQTGRPVQGTKVQLRPQYTWLPSPSVATSDESGIAEFDIDRPITVSTAWVANAEGFGVAVIEGMPDKVIKLTVDPTIAIPGLLAAKASDGSLRNTTGEPILLKHKLNQTGKFQQLDVATSDENGRFTVYLPPSEDEVAELSVKPINRSSLYEWTVNRDGSARADFVLEDDRIP